MTGREWCPDCRTRRKVVDRFTESNYTPQGEMGFKVTELDCGHYTQGQPRRIGAAPGAPVVSGSIANLRALMKPEAWGVAQ